MASVETLYGSKVVVQNNSRYFKIPYDDEAHLVHLAVANKDSLFGRNSIYIGLKKRITSEAEISKIPDGFVIIPNRNSDLELWLIEFELLKHGQDHIFRQVGGFVKALKNPKSRKDLKDAIYREINSNAESKKLLRTIIPPDGDFHYLLDNAIENHLGGITVVIDEKDEGLIEPLENLSVGYQVPIHIQEFTTFQNDLGRTIHLMDILQSTLHPVIQEKRTTSSIARKPGKRDVPLSGLAEAVRKAIRSYNYREFEVRAIHDKVIKYPDIARELARRPYLNKPYRETSSTRPWYKTPLYHRVEAKINYLLINGLIRRIEEGRYKQVKEL